MPRISHGEKAFERGVMLYQKGLSIRKAATAVGVPRSTLHVYMMQHDIDRRGPGRTITLSKEESFALVRRHQKDGLSLRELAKETGHSPLTIRRLIRSTGSLTFTSSQIRRMQRDRRDRELVKDVTDMRKAGFSLREIGRALHTDPERVRRILKTMAFLSVNGVQKT